MSEKFSSLKKREYNDNVVNIVENTINEAVQNNDPYNLKLGDLKAYKEISTLNKNELIDLIYMAFDVYVNLLSQQPKDINNWMTNYKHAGLYILQLILSQNIRKKLPFTDNDLAHFLFFANEALSRNIIWIPQNNILGVIEKKYKDMPIPSEIKNHIEECKRITEINSHSYSEYKTLEKRAQKLLDRDNGIVIIDDHNWSKIIINDLREMTAKEHKDWQEILKHALTATSSKPSQKWLKNIQPLIKELGFNSYKKYIELWFTHIRNEKIKSTRSDSDLPLSNETNRTLIKGLIWSTLASPDESVNQHTANLGLFCYKKIPEWGAISPKIGNVCIYTLGELPSLQSINALNEMLKKIKYPSAKKLIEKALDSAAKRHDLSRDDLDEISVPTFNITPNGTLFKEIGTATAILTITDGMNVTLEWKKEDGKVQKSVPTEIKEQYAESIKELKKLSKDIRSALEIQRWRIERLLLRPEPWLFYDWKKRYFEHPLLKHMVKKLIWSFETHGRVQIVIWQGNKFINLNNEEITTEDNITRVRLWHPINTNVGEVITWRNYLYKQKITQPFKQAHREVYRLTNSERNMKVYSTRFASHILKQHQMNALCKQRNWLYSLQGDFDSTSVASIYLDKWNITAELAVDREDHPLTESMIYKYITTDRLRFFKGKERLSLDEETLPLESIPQIVLSEVMRDIDLFISVCSIGNDPNWRSDNSKLNKYWETFFYKTINVPTLTRQEILLQILPDLGIAKQCHVGEKFLEVTGRLGTYQIHLSTGSVLIDKKDQSLCILEIPDDNRNKFNVFIPYEDDDYLIVILNKAVMLAYDDEIEDEEIRNQILKRS